MISLTKPAPDVAAWRAHLGHTLTCAECNAHRPCAVRRRLRRAWREPRR